MSLRVLTPLWDMGFHSTRLNIAVMAMGMYVSINMGKVKRYAILKKALQCIIFHSVITVAHPNTKSKMYNVKTEDKNKLIIVETSKPIISPRIIIAIFIDIVTEVIIIAGRIVINISKA